MVVNGSFDRKLVASERRLYRRLESGLAKYARAARLERFEGWPHENVMSAASEEMGTPDLLKFLRDVVEHNNTAPLSQAEFDLFCVIDQAVELYPGEAERGYVEPRGHCRICGALLKDCYC